MVVYSGVPMLLLEGVSKVYPGTVALRGVNLSVSSGEVHGIVGKNGAGKSTLVGIIAGIVVPTTGNVYLRGKKFQVLARSVAKREGVAIVPQEPELVPEFTVAENLMMGSYRTVGGVINWRQLYGEASRAISLSGLRLDPWARTADLSVSDRQLLMVVRACFVEQAAVIIMDEVTSCLSRNDQRTLYEIIQRMKGSGRAILFISHRLDEVLEVCDRVTVMRDGRVVTTRNCRELDLEALSSLIVGDGGGAVGGGTEIVGPAMAANVVLDVDGLTKYGSFSRVSFQVRSGEVLGLAGLRGSGRTEVLKCVAGIDQADDGCIAVGNFRGRFHTPSEALKNGVVYLPEDREREGLISGLTVRENLVLSALGRVAGRWLVNSRAEADLARRMVGTLDIKAFSLEQSVGELSGGNKQKVLVGRVMAAEPKVYLLDEPTRGVDVLARKSILRMVREHLTRTGAGVVITSPELEDLAAVCDRFVVLSAGRVVAEYRRGEVSEAELYLAVHGAPRAGGPGVSHT
jgi:ABC-type sugar transport system ATPase subunit